MSCARPLILLVEDDPDTSVLFRAMLNAEGMEVVACCNGGEARQWWQRKDRRPNLLVVDVRLPDTNGLQLLQEIKKTDNGEDELPALVLSAHGDPRMPRLCHEAGAQGFLDKLVDLERFVFKVRELITG